jgi:DNA repair protein RecO (recombination protein O)
VRERIYRTEAIVIRRIEIGEADRLLTLYTPHRGKLRVIAKGVRKPTSHLGGHVEPFARTMMLLAKGQSLDIVTQSETIAANRHLRESLEGVSHAYYMAELLDRLTPDNSENFPAYRLLAESLALLDGGAEPHILVRWYELQMLDIMGYRPELQQCVECRSPLEPVVNAFIPALGGGAVPCLQAHRRGPRPVGDSLQGAAADAAQHVGGGGPRADRSAGRRRNRAHPARLRQLRAGARTAFRRLPDFRRNEE